MPSRSVGEQGTDGKRFVRRHELTPAIRLSIACAALTARALGLRGVVTELSRKFVISRMFVYALASAVRGVGERAFEVRRAEAAATIRSESPYHLMLSLRLEGRCSVEAIATIMARFDAGFSSVGSISTHLNYFGSLVSNTAQTANDEIKVVVFLSDEIFSHRTPILVTVDSQSTAILRMELAERRTVEEWKKHWECIEDNGYIAAYLVCDEGTSLCAAQKEALAKRFRQSDTYHGIAHQLGHLVKALERAAYDAIGAEYERWAKLDSARSDVVIARRIDKYETAVAKASEAVGLYDAVCYLYRYMICQLQGFRSDGTIQDRPTAESNLGSALGLLESLGNGRISTAIKKIRRSLPELLNYLEVARTVVEGLGALGIDQEVVKDLCLAWQCGKARIKAKHAERKKASGREEQSYLETAKRKLGEGYEATKHLVYQQLDEIVQSSSLVECINSIIRPYLDSCRNQITQEALNLIMLYHNHRRYRAGKRKGKTPMEILTGKEQKEDWLELLFKLAKERDPSFNLCPAS